MSQVFLHKNHNGEPVELYGRKYILNKMHEYIAGSNIPENVAFLGVKGVGKSELLNVTFSKENIIKYYKEAKVISSFVSIPDGTNSMKSFYSYINTAILEGLDMIEKLDEDIYNAIILDITNKKNKILARSVEVDDATMESVLNKTIEVMQSYNLKILVIIDDFEKFADSSNLKKAQYKFMRELANSGKISLFICTNQDLTKVSEEMKGSGFENIFIYEELRALRYENVEEWILDVLDNLNFEFDDEVIEWIYEVSGGIPLISGECANIVYYYLKENEVFNEKECYLRLYKTTYSLMNLWWNSIDSGEKNVLKELINGNSYDSIERDCLVKKGYLYEDDNGMIKFTTPLFEIFIIDLINSNKLDINEELIDLNDDKLRVILEKIIKDINDPMARKLEIISNRVFDINNKLQSIIEDMPSKEEFYRVDDGELDIEKYEEAISEYISDKIVEVNTNDICKDWNIPVNIWNGFSDIRKNDCSMAYRLIKLVFFEDVAGLDYTPVTVMLGNFLEGILNDKLLSVLKKIMPTLNVKYKNGSYGPLRRYHGTMTIGGFAYIFKNQDVYSNINSRQVSQTMIDNFKDKLVECHIIRNKADHPGDITTFEDKNKFIQNMFIGDNSILRVIYLLDSIIN